MNSISEIYCVHQRAVEYAIKHNNNSKVAVKYKTSCQQIKYWKDRYDGTVQSLLPISRRPKSHPNQHTQEEIDLIMKKYRKFGYERRCQEKAQKLHRRKKKVEQAKYPGERVHIDIKYVPEECIQFGTCDQKQYQITALDEYTRKRVLRIVDEKSTYQTSKFLEVLEKKLEFFVKKVQTDNGKKFTNSESEKKTLFELKLEKKEQSMRPSIFSMGERELIDSKYHTGKKFESKEEPLRAVGSKEIQYQI